MPSAPSMRPRRPLPNELTRKRAPRLPPSLFDGRIGNAALQAKLRHEVRGLRALERHYGIDKRKGSDEGQVRYFMLALELARDFVPWFREMPDDPRRIWDAMKLAHLYVDVEQARRSAKNLTEALELVAVSGFYENPDRRDRRYDVDSLRERYKQAKKLDRKLLASLLELADGSGSLPPISRPRPAK